MSLEALENFNKKLLVYKWLIYIFSILLDVSLRLLYVWLWNAVTGDKLNEFLFGTPQLGYLKGMVILYSVHLYIHLMNFNTTFDINSNHKN